MPIAPQAEQHDSPAPPRTQAGGSDGEDVGAEVGVVVGGSVLGRR